VTLTRVLILSAAVLAASGCAATPSAAKPRAGDSTGLAAAASRPAEVPDQPATHVGRKVLRNADVIVCGKVVTATSAGHGAVVGKVTPSQWLRGQPGEDDAPLVVMTNAADALPPAGRESLFVLAARPDSENFGLLDVAPLDDADGASRLATMKKYLEIEALPEPAARLAALREYLRGAVAADDRWTRSNAVREYAALAAEVPGSLTEDDRPPLEGALERTRDAQLRGLAQSALDECPGKATRKSSHPGTAADAAVADDPVAAPTARYVAKEASVAARRQAVIDAAVQAGARSAPLLARALEDEAPPVREAAAAAAGEYRVATLEPRIAAMLVSDPSPIVRRTVVVAAGYLKSSGSVPTLAILGKEGRPFSLEAVFALARIRDDAALTALRSLEAEATDRERREVLRFLLSDAFVEQERTLAQKP
jgi:hypothetical protein